jgi:hypothetical protein
MLDLIYHKISSNDTYYIISESLLFIKSLYIQGKVTFYHVYDHAYVHAYAHAYAHVCVHGRVCDHRDIHLKQL